MTPGEIQADYVRRMGEPLGLFVYHLQNDVHRLHRKWREFTELFGPESGHSDLLNRVAANFFHYLFRLQFEDAIIHIARLTDPAQNRHQENLSIKRLPLLVTDMSLMAALNSSVDAAVTLSAFARAHRDKWIAHSDFAHHSGSVPVLRSVEQKQVGEAISAIQAVVRQIEAHHGLPPSVTMDDPWGAKSLVQYLERHPPGGLAV